MYGEIGMDDDEDKGTSVSIRIRQDDDSVLMFTKTYPDMVAWHTLIKDYAQLLQGIGYIDVPNHLQVVDTVYDGMLLSEVYE